MAIVFAVRGTSKNARYSNGGATGVDQNSEWTVTTDATSLCGSSLVAGANNNRKAIVWPARFNTPNSRNISILLRQRPAYSNAPTASRPALPGLYVGNGRLGRFEFTHALTTGNINLLLINNAGSNSLNAAIGNWLPTSGTAYDLVFTWDGTTNTNAIKFYIDGVLLGQATASAAMAAAWGNTSWSEISLGDTVAGAVWNGSSVEELVVWDTIIDPTSVALVSGTGSLNGASRTSLVDVAAFDGSVYSNPGAANVRSGTGYTYAGVSTTGSLVVPSLANTKIGVAGDGGTGTYDGTDRHSDPGVANVRLGTAYKSNSETDNRTGTLAATTDTDPGVGNVRSGIAYSIDGVAKTGTLSVPTPSSGTAGTLDINAIKEYIRYVLSTANTVGGSPLDLSNNMDKRVKAVLKINPDKIRPDASVVPCVTVFTSQKNIELRTIAKDQVNGKRKAELILTIVGIVWNDFTADFREDPADEDLENLMENIEAILRHYGSLDNNATWQFPTGVTYHSARDEKAHYRIGAMDLKVTAYY
jgi:hypothetical protein